MNEIQNVLQNIHSAYQRFLVSDLRPFDLHSMLSPGQFELDDYCTTFRSHHHRAPLKRSVEQFGRQFDIWLPSAENYISCALYLFSKGHLFRMPPVLKNCAIDFYLNDTIGREIYPKLTPDQQREAAELVGRMTDPVTVFNLPLYATSLERANREMMIDIRDSSPLDWFNDFLKLYNQHVAMSCRNCNTLLTEKVPEIEEYILERCHVSGMHHTVYLLEYCEGQFLDWEWLETNKLADELREIRHIAACIGCLMNDLFSFEKEVIDFESDNNLVAIVALNSPTLDLLECIMQSAGIVRQYLSDFAHLTDAIRQKPVFHLDHNSNQVDRLEAHLMALENCVQASWVWQVATPRYKRKLSIWKETRLTSLEIA
ncbi:terpene synthase family protein [Pedobacter paludis]|uniref:Terpene synthase n=1 Tax=Pedobacter paludis TaxID=2203212 RepID=A0A317F0H7_9SPHI|nr:terpene synthase family protein [Pedobacter paludis]PWS32222.1 hypothetical protein DF947_10665 [Pedobacter paludis]